MRKENKAVVIEQLKGYLSEYPHFYFANTEGMNAQQTAELRRKANNAGIKMLVVKNTLLRRALSEVETDFAPLYSALKGNTTVLFTKVANAPAKLIKDLIKEKKVFKVQLLSVSLLVKTDLCVTKSFLTPY